MRGIFNNADATMFLIFFIKAYAAGSTHLNCLDLNK